MRSRGPEMQIMCLLRQLEMATSLGLGRMTTCGRSILPVSTLTISLRLLPLIRTTRAVFSNYGERTVDLGTAGVGILSTTPNNSYGTFDGTSMATPHVAGVVSLVRDAQPDWTYDQAIYQVLSTVDPINALSGITVTGGRLNAAAAVRGAVNPAPEIQVLRGWLWY